MSTHTIEKRKPLFECDCAVNPSGLFECDCEDAPEMQAIDLRERLELKRKLLRAREIDALKLHGQIEELEKRLLCVMEFTECGTFTDRDFYVAKMQDICNGKDKLGDLSTARFTEDKGEL